jgi:hypothetical protein
VLEVNDIKNAKDGEDKPKEEILKIIEKNEKANEQIPDSVIS